MTTTRPERRPVDIELLADYLAGLLDATAAGDVRDLVRTDPEWGATAAILGGAERQVTATLADTPYGREPMPADVATRITDALGSEARRSDSGPVRRVVVPITDSRPVQVRRLARRGWVLAAAAVIVLAGFVGLLGRHIVNGDNVTSGSAVSGTASTPLVAPYAVAELPTLPGVTITSTGTDYGVQHGTLTTSAPRLPGPLGNTRAPDLAQGSVSVPAELRRLTSAVQLSACLAAVRSAFGGTVTGVDFATYRLTPAVIITLSPSGRVVAVGGDCGLPGSGPATIATISHP